MKVYRYDGECFDCTEEGKGRLALALTMYEPGAADELDFERWLNDHEKASEVLWLVKQYGAGTAEDMLVSDFEAWYAEENRDDLLHDFSDSYEVVELDEEEEEGEA